jgi:hypothetical protein
MDPQQLEYIQNQSDAPTLIVTFVLLSVFVVYMLFSENE